MFKKSAKIMSALTAAVISASVLSAAAGAVGAVTVQPPMHNSNGQPVNYNPGYVRPVNNGGVTLTVPTYTNGYRIRNTSVVSANIAQATYANGAKTLIVRKARGSVGMSYSYPGTFRTYVGGVPVIYRGTRDGYYVATWSRGQYNYIVKSSHPLNLGQMNGLVMSVLNG
ncbi:MAG: hypothetical protein IJ251_09665 [Oscillospiraceae bacterium]|nr:hypothetical protein [Oscillospiraceae bacterium]